MTRSEAYDRHPGHVLAFDAEPVRARVRVAGEVVAETRRALRLREGSYPPVLYFPREDIRMDRLERVDHRTHCPFKGDATYFDYRGTTPETRSPRAPTARIEHVAWSYEQPFDQMQALEGHLAFYADRAAIEEAES